MRCPFSGPSSQESLWGSGAQVWECGSEGQGHRGGFRSHRQDPFEKVEPIIWDAATHSSPIPSRSTRSSTALPLGFSQSPDPVGSGPRCASRLPSLTLAGLWFGQLGSPPVWVLSQLSPVHRPQAQESNYENLSQMSPQGPSTAVCSLRGAPQPPAPTCAP